MFICSVHSYHLSCKVEKVEPKFAKKKRTGMRLVCLSVFSVHVGPMG